MPKLLTFNASQGSVVNTYLYAADGRKLTVNNGSLKTDYVGNVIYENGTFKRLLVDGGYYEGGQYYFYVKDHLGNNRITANQNAAVVQSTQYYPFGMSFSDESGQTAQPYKYNGKELYSAQALNLYDYGARHMEPALGRFTTMDPHAESYYAWSPYHYAGNNPINITDPTGMDWYSYEDENGIIQYQWDSDIHLQKDLDKIRKEATYHGKVHEADGTYYSLFGWQYDSESTEAKIMSKMDEAIITYRTTPPEKYDMFGNLLTTGIEPTNFDIGIYASGNSSYQHIKFDIEGGYAVYYLIGKGQENRAKFGATGYLSRMQVRGFSNWGSGDLKDGIPLRFERKNTSGTRVTYAADMVFTNQTTAKKINQIYDKLF